MPNEQESWRSGVAAPVTAGALARAASVAGLARRAGDLVVGLTAVRRTRGLALVLVAKEVSANTRRELAGLGRRGVEVRVLEDLDRLSVAVGCPGARILAVKRGPLAAEIARRLAPGRAGSG